LTATDLVFVIVAVIASPLIAGLDPVEATIASPSSSSSHCEPASLSGTWAALERTM
jgi:hypothetical protein